jgi:hypothetical protein
MFALGPAGICRAEFHESYQFEVSGAFLIFDRLKFLFFSASAFFTYLRPSASAKKYRNRS